MGKIQQLDSQTANMIAAGEVVERPRGVVKELVENAIDAGSTRIAVQVQNGGLDRIVVRDNGCGMDSADATLCFGRHATSKIHSSQDLWNIHTLGFRGEALPSIASVAKVTLWTSDGQDSTRVVVNYGTLESAEACPCDQGTRIAVEGLFYRTPARLKNMRSGAYENSLIQELLMRFAMSHPEIAFSLESDGREGFRTTGGGDLLEVLYLCWGRQPAEAALPFEGADYDYQLSGYLIKPEQTRATKNFIQIFLNRRLIHTYRLDRAVEDGYAGYLPADRHPMAVFNVEMDPHLVDVNVHPSKWEVRLSKENQLEYLIRDKIAETLKKADLTPSVRKETQASAPLFYAQTALDLQAPMKVEEEVKKAEEDLPPRLPVEKESVPAEETEEDTREDNRLPELTILGQMHARYIVCTCAKGLALVDPRAAQQRLLYEKILHSLKKAHTLQQLLVPVTVKADAALVQRVDELNGRAAVLGLYFEPFGPDTFLVRAVPAWLQDLDVPSFLEDLLEAFRQDQDFSDPQEHSRLARQAAERNCVHVHQQLSVPEMTRLIQDLGRADNPWTSPAGQPCLILLDEKDLEKEFRR